MSKRIDWRDMPPIPKAEHDAAVKRLVEGDEKTPPLAPSQTFLKHRDRCHRAAFLYLKHRGGPGSHELNRGSVFHLVVERLTNEILMLGSGTLSEDDRRRAAELADTPDEAEAWLEEQAGGKVPVERAKQELNAVLAEHPELTVPAYERDQLRMMLTHWALGSYFQNPEERIIGVEQMLELPIETATGTWIVRGKIDLIEQQTPWMLDLTDYKTSWNMPSGDSWHEGGHDLIRTQDGFETRPRWGGDFQTQVYATLAKFGRTPDGLSLGQGVERFRVFLRFPRYLREEGLAYKEAELSVVQLEDFRLDLASQLEGVEKSLKTRKWQPTPGSHCGECPAEYECPLPRHLRAESQGAAIDSIEDAEKLGASWLFMTRRATALKKAIKAAAIRFDVNEIYIADDLVLKFIPKDRESLKTGSLPKLREGIEGAVEYGMEFNLEHFVTRSQGTDFDKRKAPKRRKEGTDGNDD